MRAQREDTKNISFLGRKRINQKDELFQANLIRQAEGTANCIIWYNRAEIFRNVGLDYSDPSMDLVMDIFVLGRITREVLPLDGDTAAILVNEIPEGANPELRLKIVANDTDNIGRIYAATAKKISFKLPDDEKGEDRGEASKTFLRFEQSDQLTGRLVDVEWRESNSDLFIRFDRSFYQKHKDTALLAVAIYPDMVRSVATHLLCRHEQLSDLETSSMAYHWLRFIEDRLGIILVGEDSLFDENSEQEMIPDLVEQIVTKFMASKFRAGKTFLEGFLDGN